MIPVKNPAGVTASGLHHQSEGTPDQNTDQIADIENHADQKKHGIIEDTAVVQHTDHCQQTTPQNKHFVGCLCGCDDIGPQGFMVDLLPDRTETAGKSFMEPSGSLFLMGMICWIISKTHTAHRIWSTENPLKKFIPSRISNASGFKRYPAMERSRIKQRTISRTIYFFLVTDIDIPHLSCKS